MYTQVCPYNALLKLNRCDSALNEDMNLIHIDDADRAIKANARDATWWLNLEPMQLVTNFATAESCATWWLNMQIMQVAPPAN